MAKSQIKQIYNERNSKIYSDQVRQLYLHAPISMVGTLVNSLILACVLWNVISHEVIALWLGVNLLMTLSRYMMIYKYRRVQFEYCKQEQWGRLFLYGTTLSGIIWGSAGVFLFPDQSIAHQVFLAFVMGGMAAGAMGAYAVHMTTFLSFILPILVPINIHFFMQDGTFPTTMGAMMILFSFIIISIAKQLNNSITQVFLMKFQNIDLVNCLMIQKESVEKLNKELNTEIIDRKKTDEDLKLSKKNAENLRYIAEDATKAKSEFLATMSHEIRTPLNGLIGMIDILAETQLSPEQRDYFNSARLCTDSLLVLTNDILDFSKIEAGKMDLDIIDFDLRITLEEVTDIMAIKAEEKGLVFSCLIHDDVPTLLRGDPGRIRQVLTNLVGNAIKFVEKGAVSIHVSLKNETESDATLYVEVADTGIGIPANRIDSLFKSFSQADTSTTRKYGGTGLGLAISKQLVELMNGRIGVESEVDVGSVFWFTIVLNKQGESIEKGQSIPKEIRGRKILVIDNNDIDRRVVIQHLKGWDCRFDEAKDGEEALWKLRNGFDQEDPFHIAIIDMHLPDMDGEFLGHKIKTEQNLNSTVIVMATSIGKKGDATRLREIGFSAYFTKPVKKSHLFECLTTVIGIQGDSSKPLITRYTLEEDKIANLKADRVLHVLLAEDNKMNQKVLVNMLNTMGHSVVVSENGKEAVEVFKKNYELRVGMNDMEKGFEKRPFDIILMDGQMPEMDGLDATREIRMFEKLKAQCPKLKGKKKEGETPSCSTLSAISLELSAQSEHIPIIGITASAMKEDRERFLAAGMDDYLAKPVKRKDLAAIIKRITTLQNASIS